MRTGPSRRHELRDWGAPAGTFQWAGFPYSSRPSARLDLDHTWPYRWDGTPGQTDPDNLGPLGRRVHRGKTRAGWQLRQPHPGLFTWRSPLGRHYRITPDHPLAAIPAPQEPRTNHAPNFPIGAGLTTLGTRPSGDRDGKGLWRSW